MTKDLLHIFRMFEANTQRNDVNTQAYVKTLRYVSGCACGSANDSASTTDREVKSQSNDADAQTSAFGCHGYRTANSNDIGLPCVFTNAIFQWMAVSLDFNASHLLDLRLKSVGSNASNPLSGGYLSGHSQNQASRYSHFYDMAHLQDKLAQSTHAVGIDEISSLLMRRMDQSIPEWQRSKIRKMFVAWKDVSRNNKERKSRAFSAWRVAVDHQYLQQQLAAQWSENNFLHSHFTAWVLAWAKQKQKLNVSTQHYDEQQRFEMARLWRFWRNAAIATEHQKRLARRRQRSALEAISLCVMKRKDEQILLRKTDDYYHRACLRRGFKMWLSKLEDKKALQQQLKEANRQHLVRIMGNSFLYWRAQVRLRRLDREGEKARRRFLQSRALIAWKIALELARSRELLCTYYHTLRHRRIMRAWARQVKENRAVRLIRFSMRSFKMRQVLLWWHKLVRLRHAGATLEEKTNTASKKAALFCWLVRTREETMAIKIARLRHDAGVVQKYFCAWKCKAEAEKERRTLALHVTTTWYRCLSHQAFRAWRQVVHQQKLHVLKASYFRLSRVFRLVRETAINAKRDRQLNWIATANRKPLVLRRVMAGWRAAIQVSRRREQIRSVIRHKSNKELRSRCWYHWFQHTHFARKTTSLRRLQKRHLLVDIFHQWRAASQPRAKFNALRSSFRHEEMSRSLGKWRSYVSTNKQKRLASPMGRRARLHHAIKKWAYNVRVRRCEQILFFQSQQRLRRRFWSSWRHAQAKTHRRSKAFEDVQCFRYRHILLGWLAHAKARRFERKKCLASTFARWARRAKRSQQGRVNAEAFVAVRHSRLKRKVLSTMRDIAAAFRDLDAGQLLPVAHAFWELQQKNRALGLLAWHTTHRSLRSSRLAKADAFFIKSFFAQWRTKSAYAQQYTRSVTVLEELHARRRLVRVLPAWARLALHSTLSRTAYQTAAKKRVVRLLRSCVKDRKSMEKRKLLGDSNLLGYSLLHGVRAFQNNVRAEQRLVFRASRAVYQDRMVRPIFVAWFQEASARHQFSVVCARRTTKMFRAWHQLLLRRRKAVQLRRKQLLRGAFSTWAHMLRKQRQLQAIAQQVWVCMRRRRFCEWRRSALYHRMVLQARALDAKVILKQCFGKWLETYALRSSLDQCRRRWHQRLMKRVVTKWKAQSDGRKKRTEKLQQATHHYYRRILRSWWRCWTVQAQVGSGCASSIPPYAVIRQFRTEMEKRKLRAVLLGWKEGTDEKICERRSQNKITMVAKARAVSLIRQYWGGWKTVVARNTECHMFRQNQLKVMLHRVFVGWQYQLILSQQTTVIGKESLLRCDNQSFSVCMRAIVRTLGKIIYIMRVSTPTGMPSISGEG